MTQLFIAQKSVFGSNVYPSIHEKAAALFESIAMNHAFHNANKRTDLASLIVFFKINIINGQWGLKKNKILQLM
ncbi:MAG TPA: Fic family protein [Pseudogracilibacillus sp.]|nr:Fic family protein [Pseudogracilibacillus sp.]